MSTSAVASEVGKNAHPEILRPEEYERWDALVDRSPHGTVFHYSWWLEATGYDFEILVSRDERGELVAGIPLPRKKRKGLTLFHSPMLTPYLGPVFDIACTLHSSKRLSLMRGVGESLARAIAGYDSFLYHTATAAPDLQGFLWAGYRVELASYTFRFEAGTSENQILQGMAKHHQRNLAKAQRRQRMVDTENKIDVLMELNRKTYIRQGVSMPYPEELPRRLWAAARAHGKVNIYVSGTTTGVPVAALLVVHDARTAYQIVAGINPEVEHLGGSNLVEWHAIQDALRAGRAFDFEGSSLRGVELYYRRWGGMTQPIWRLVKVKTLQGALAWLWVRWRHGRTS